MPLYYGTILEPPEEDAELWRYLDLAKFSWTILKKSIWFSSITALASGDPSEGVASREGYMAAVEKEIEGAPPELKELWRIDLASFYADHDMESRENLVASCWHKAPFESVAMWKIYASDVFGVAIVSSRRRMDKAFSGIRAEVHIGNVEYVDPRNYAPRTDNFLKPIYTKRNHFAYEHEVRLSIVDVGWRQWAKSGGVAVPVDLNELIDRVIVSPLAPSWFKDVVSGLCGQAGLAAPVVQSDLYAPQDWARPIREEIFRLQQEAKAAKLAEPPSSDGRSS